MNSALDMAKIDPQEVDIVNLHATGTGAGDYNEVVGIKEMFPSERCSQTFINFTKGHIGHAMGAAGALELAGNLPSFGDGLIHPGRGIEELDPQCALVNLVYQGPKKSEKKIKYILNNSFGMLGINSCLVVKSWE